MKKRMTIVLFGMGVFIAALSMVKLRQVQAAIAQGSAFQPPPEAVTTIVTREQQWAAGLSAIGTVAAVHGVTVSADLPGIVEEIRFQSGERVKEGAVLVQLDTRQERAQLAAAEAQLKLARLNFDRINGLLDKGVVSQADHDQSAAELTQGEARVGEIRATIERKTIRAPFSGVLGIRQVNLGQYLAGGDPIVPLQSLDPVFVDFSVPQQEVGRVRVGAAVSLIADGVVATVGTAADGKVTAVNSVVDPATRNVQVQATFANPGESLRPGMFVEARVALGREDAVIALPASAISYAPYGDSVYVVSNLPGPDGKPYLGVRQQFVKLGRARGDQVVIAEGVKVGEEVVSSGGFKLRNGGAVVVNNTVRPTDSLTPQPEDS